MDFEVRDEEKRRQSMYRRSSFHHFHVDKEVFTCCCCIPIHMAYHIIAAADVSIAVILGVKAADYAVLATDGTEKTPIVKSYYYAVFLTLLTALIVYQLPSLPMYLFTLMK